MGDLNDDPSTKVLRKHLRAAPDGGKLKRENCLTVCILVQKGNRLIYITAMGKSV